MAKVFSGQVGIVPALDIETQERFDLVVKATSKVEGVVGYKLGLTSVLRLGLGEAMRRLRDLTDLPVLYDHQKAGPDMPDMAKKFTAMCAEAGVDGLILFPVAGPTAVDGFVGEALKAGIPPVVGGEIPVPDYGVSGGGYLVDDALDRILARSVAAGADHFVLPAHDAAKITRWSNWIGANVEKPLVFITGFGALGGTIEAALAASQACPRRFAIVGRLITEAADPAAAAAKLYAQMQAGEAVHP
ncbi:orotidine 5-phosphate decarboxylase [Xanthobacter dioxanivorans]|uniref:Orotidine 5-phosphate decarboxylase n=1 Tax=Xanthobacter dioxanivorans TaxID=2528964 RepID=A0A974PQE8_9HYPH|nr:orotidine 5'-phosphate decarboxylase / HUMPS family protein [Xanthobacter dioxanivorans]QRG07770.1 orotidine 5-phosphate decarboxylase [Xanthobacter dioxanivorans]